MIEQGLSLSNVTIGVLTVLPEEFAAACAVLGCYQVVSADGRIYKIGIVRRRDNSGERVIAVSRLLDMGNNSSAVRTAKLKQDCPKITDVIMCGIAGAVPHPEKASDHVRLGDVVATNGGGVVQYDFIRESEHQIEIQSRPRPPSNRLLEVARLLESEEKRGERPWERYITQAVDELGKVAQSGRGWERPPAVSDRLCEFHRSRPMDHLVWLARAVRIPKRFVSYKLIAHPHDPDRIDGVPRIFHGVIASANNLQKNPRRRNFLRDRYKAKAVEMEGSGVADAAYQDDAGYFIVRSTVDYCNDDKNDDWHHYAAVVAAAYTKALLEAAPLPPYLAGRTGTLVTTVMPSEGFQNVVNVSPPDRTVTESHVNVVEGVVQRDLERALAGVLEDEGRRRIGPIKQALDAWEFDGAYFLGDELSAWVERYSDKLSNELLREIYELLVRVEIVRAARQGGDGTPDLSRADFFLAKAKDVSRH